MAATRAPFPLALGALLATFALPGVGRADPPPETSSAAAHVRVYDDDDHITVVSPSATGTAVVGKTAVDLAFDVDIVTGASVDVVSQASPDPIEEERYEGGVTVTHSVLERSDLSLGGIWSYENDYDALRLHLGSTSELLHRQTTLDLGLTVGFDWVASATRPEFSEIRRGYQLSAAVTQILDRRTYLDVVAEFVNYIGYHASPYRMVPVRTEQTTALELFSEETPRRRTAGALLARVRRAFGAPARFFVHADYRIYRDSWEVASHTVSVAPLFELSSAVKLGATGRLYTQSAADFYEPEYVREPGQTLRYRTRDRTLGGMHSWYGGATLEVAFLDDTRAVADGGFVQFYFHDFPLQAERSALLGSFGVLHDF